MSRLRDLNSIGRQVVPWGELRNVIRLRGVISVVSRDSRERVRDFDLPTSREAVNRNSAISELTIMNR